MALMAKRIPFQLILGFSILIIGGGLVLGEYVLVRWLPGHRERVREDTLKPHDYHNDALGLDIQIADGIYGNVETFPGGVKIGRAKFWSVGPSLTITSQPNPDQTWEFSPQDLATWESRGVTENLDYYHLEHTKINNRDSMLIRQLKGRYMHVTARIMCQDKIIEADCTTGGEDETLFTDACDGTLRSIKIAGPEPPPPAPLELKPAGPLKLKR
jgi:hypothetical protein